MSYVPALVLTLYDGYYIYTPVDTDGDGTFDTHSLKPYVYYTKEYVQGNNRIVINFSLDNYVTVYYYEGNGSSYTSKSGYLEVTTTSSTGQGIYINGSTVRYNGIAISSSETLYERTATNSGSTYGSYTSTSAIDYYKEAYSFTTWYNEIINSKFSNYASTLAITSSNSALKGKASAFNDEKTDVIETTITNNLIQAMETYGRNAGVDFAMPELSGDDWDTILNNVCLIAFLQGIPVGTSTFNDYVILASTENEQYVDSNSLYFQDSTGVYHRIGCTHMAAGTITRI